MVLVWYHDGNKNDPIMIPNQMSSLLQGLETSLIHQNLVLLSLTRRMTTSLTTQILKARIFPRAETSNFAFPKALFGRSC